MPSRCLFKPEQQVPQFSSSFLHELYPFTYFFFKNHSVLGDLGHEAALTDPWALSLLPLVPLQKWQPGFELIWGLLAIHPTPPQKEQTAEAYDAYEKIKGFI